MKADRSTARNFTDLKLNKRKETHEPRGVREERAKGNDLGNHVKKYNNVFNILQ